MDRHTHSSARIRRCLSVVSAKYPIRECRSSQRTHRFVDMFSKPAHLQARDTLVKYYSLLHYTRLSHASLDHLYPLSNTNTHASSLPSPVHAAAILLKQLLNTFLHPRALCFLPPFLVHRPAYIFSTLAARFLAKREEEEGQAQFKAIFGGFGSGLSYGLVTWRLSKWLQGIASGTQGVFLSTRPGLFSAFRYVGGVLAGQEGALKRTITLASLFYGVSWILVRWHNSLIDSKPLFCLCASFLTKLVAYFSGNYRQLAPPYSSVLSDC